MESSSPPLRVDRLTELVICLTGADDGVARVAVSDAVERHGDWGDGLLNVAEALVSLRRSAGSEPTDSAPIPA